jgi:hypothetical protein
MAEYTPTVEEVRSVIADGRWNTRAVDAEMFDRMIASVERAAAVKALRDFSGSGELNTYAAIAADKRADRIESEGQA